MVWLNSVFYILSVNYTRVLYLLITRNFAPSTLLHWVTMSYFYSQGSLTNFRLIFQRNISTYLQQNKCKPPTEPSYAPPAENPFKNLPFKSAAGASTTFCCFTGCFLFYHVIEIIFFRNNHTLNFIISVTKWNFIDLSSFGKPWQQRAVIVEITRDCVPLKRRPCTSRQSGWKKY